MTGSIVYTRANRSNFSGNSPVGTNSPVSQPPHLMQQLSSTNSQSVTDTLLLESVIEVRSPVLKYIPKASRSFAAGKLSVILDRIVSAPDNMEAWRQLLLFTYCCFGVRERGGKKHRSSLATKVNKSMSDFPIVAPAVRQVKPINANKKKSKLLNVISNLAARVSAKLEEGDIRGAVRMAASNDTIAPYDDETVAALRQLHPQRAVSVNGVSQPLDVNNSPVADLILSDNDIIAAITSFPTGSAGGLDSLRPPT
jgi:hypothetical protein